MHRDCFHDGRRREAAAHLVMEHAVAMVAIYALLALSFMLVLRVGEVSFGQQAFFAFGAYSSSVATSMLGIAFPPAVVLAALIGAGGAWLVGLVALRLRGIGFSLFMLVFAECVREAASQWTWQMRLPRGMVGPEGAMGFSAIDAFARAGWPTGWQATIVCTITAGVFLVVNRALTGIWGVRVAAVSADWELAEARGVDAEVVRRSVFTVAGCVAAISGSLFAHYVTFIDPSNFGLMTGVHALAYTLIGGTGHVLGALAGTAFDVWLLEWTRIAGPLRMVVFGMIIVIALIVMPRGFFSRRRTSVEVAP